MNLALRLLLILGFSTGSAGASEAALDLNALPRSVGREPSYRGKPEYALLVFGPEASTRIWLVRDGSILYVDRNANGDLNDPGERIESTSGENSPATEKVHEFKVGEIFDARLTHRDLRIQTCDLSVFQGRWARDFVARNPDALGYAISVETETHDPRRPGRVRRLRQHVENADRKGMLQFSNRPETAPVIHFGGPVQVQHFMPNAVYENLLVRGLPTDYISVLATNGLGPGSTVLTDFEGFLPPDARPRLECELDPPTPGSPPLLMHFDLPQRSCGFQLYGEVTIPEFVTSSEVRCRLTMTGWDEGHVAPSSFTVKLDSPLPVPEEPVSSGLIRSLKPSVPDDQLCSLRYSADGKRLVAGGVPSGTIEIWNIDESRSISQIQTGPRGRSTFRYLEATPNLESIFTWTSNWSLKPDDDPARDAGKWNITGSLKKWDGLSGMLQQEFPTRTGFGVVSASRTLNGRGLFVGEHSETKSAASVFYFDAGQFLPVSESHGMLLDVSSDGREAVMLRLHDSVYARSLDVMDIPSGQPRVSIPIEHPWTSAMSLQFGPESQSVVLTAIENASRGRYVDGVVVVSAFDGKSGKEIWKHTAPAEWEFESGYPGRAPDGKTVIVALRKRGASGEVRSMLIDALSGAVRGSIAFPPSAIQWCGAWTNDGNMAAIVTQERPTRTRRLTDAEIPQARVHLIDARTATIIRTIVQPRGQVGDVAFAPDGKSLAIGSSGAVHIWDINP